MLLVLLLKRTLVGKLLMLTEWEVDGVVETMVALEQAIVVVRVEEEVQ
jgi:hypothetical protein